MSLLGPDNMSKKHLTICLPDKTSADRRDPAFRISLITKTKINDALGEIQNSLKHGQVCYDHGNGKKDLLTFIPQPTTEKYFNSWA